MRLADLMAGENASFAAGDPASVRVCDLTEDSRTALPGSLFIARRGLSRDGREHAPQAVGLGASAILTDDPDLAHALGARAVVVVVPDVAGVTGRVAERFFGHPSRALRLIGVTGTNGKTTTAHLVHHLLNAAGVRCGLIGTVEIDDGRGRAPSEMTTPPAIELSRTLATMVESGCRAAVMEVSSHALHQRRADALRFEIGIITNITRDHLDYHGSMEAYAAAKRRLFTLLDARPGGPGLSIVNADDPEAASLAGPRRLACSAAGEAIGGWSVRTKPAGLTASSLTLRGPRGVAITQRLALIGPHNAMNAAQAAAAVADTLAALGRTDHDIATALRHGLSLAHPPPGRLEPAHAADDDLAVLIDYAHTDDAIDRALSAVRAALAPPGRVWAVFGAGGDRDRGKRPKMGRAASLRADRLIITSDNPRSESPSAIIAAVLEGVPQARRDRVAVHADRARAIHEAVRSAAPGDAVVILGKGHERVQVIKNDLGHLEPRPFDDAKEARIALAARRGSRPSPIEPASRALGASP